MPFVNRPNVLRVYGIRKSSLGHGASRIGAWEHFGEKHKQVVNLPSHDLSPAAVAEILNSFRKKA